MASALSADRYRVIGGLLAVWAVFDEQTEDGFLEGFTLKAMDEEIGWPGFCEAMVGVAWLSFQEHAGLSMPEFGEHNGQSAKRRATDAKRKRDERESDKSPEPVRGVSTSNADKKETRGRGRGTDRTPPPSPQGGEALFDRFWAAYPRKVGKDAARKVFAKRKPETALVDSMLRAIAWQVESDQWKRDAGQYIPHPSTWLNQGRWQDEKPGESTLWHETRSGVEARGIELGIGPWAETEQFAAYRARVVREHEQRTH